MAKPLPTLETKDRTLELAGNQPSAGQAGLPTSVSVRMPDSNDSIDFDSLSGSSLFPELQSLVAAPPSAPDDVDSLLQRYQAEKHGQGRRDRRAKGGPVGALGSQETRAESSNSTGHGALPPLQANGHAPLPPLTAPHPANPAETERLRAENAELRHMVTELRQVLEANDPQVWEQQRQEAEQLLAAKDEELTQLRAECDEFKQKMQTHRLVPSDDDLAQMSDELEKERCQTAQDRREVEEAKRQLKEDEESLMKQMREMEVSMARDRAELARQRTELQRLKDDVRHELELLQRGDATVKERLAQFQRRQDSSSKGPVSPPAPPSADQSPAAGNSKVFKRLFGQG